MAIIIPLTVLVLVPLGTLAALGALVAGTVGNSVGNKEGRALGVVEGVTVGVTVGVEVGGDVVGATVGSDVLLPLMALATLALADLAIIIIPFPFMARAFRRIRRRGWSSSGPKSNRLSSKELALTKIQAKKTASRGRIFIIAFLRKDFVEPALLHKRACERASECVACVAWYHAGTTSNDAQRLIS